MEMITIYFDGANKRPLYAMLKDNKYQFEEDIDNDYCLCCKFDLGKRPFSIYYNPDGIPYKPGTNFLFEIDHRRFGWCQVDLELDIDYEIVDVSI
jgi:hypothetical protein